MSLDRFKRLAGITDNRPTLEEAKQDLPAIEDLNPAQAAELYDQIRQAFEYDKLREMKLGLGSPAAISHSFDLKDKDKPYAATIDTKKLPKPEPVPHSSKPKPKTEDEETFEELAVLDEASEKDRDVYYHSLGRAQHLSDVAHSATSQIGETPSSKMHAVAYHAHDSAHQAWTDASDKARDLGMRMRAARIMDTNARPHRVAMDTHAKHAGHSMK